MIAAGKQHAELQAEHCHDRDKAVFQNVFIDDLALAQAFCAGGADVVFAKFFDHA